MAGETILLVGTADTKSDEIQFLRQKIEALGCNALVMDVGVLTQGHCTVDIPNHEVAFTAGSSLEDAISRGDENTAMTMMAKGAAKLAVQLFVEGKINGLLVLGGTMGTDLALDVAQSLPLGFPKVILSTIAYSHLIPPERITPDLIMILWAGGLYGLNSLCKSTLTLAAGAVIGAAASAKGAASATSTSRPLIGMTSLGKSCLNYMEKLIPALESRGFEVAVFHSTGMGGRAFESLAAAGRFALVIDLCLQELANQIGSSCVTSGADRLLGAGRHGTPQIVAPGAADMIDFPAWQAVPEVLAGRPTHVHNRLIASATSPLNLRKKIAREIVQRLALAYGASHLLIPLQGVQAWDLLGEPLHDPEGLNAMTTELLEHARQVTNIKTNFQFTACDMHINDEAFSDQVLAIVDEWSARGVIKKNDI
jgi:uncharacterized protein (UPF0261 family)